ncbi:MAG: DegT/DnrJ/EryC1/StrS family aminotransferase, partial [Reyranellales bacterium]
DELQAAFLRVKLGKLDEWNERRRVLAARYDDRLSGVAGLGLPRAPQWAEPVWHLYVVRTNRRAELMKALDAAGIGSLVHYPIPPHLQQAYADLGLPRGSFPLAETLADTVLSLPISPHMPVESVDRIANVVRSCLVESAHEKTRP